MGGPSGRRREGSARRVGGDPRSAGQGWLETQELEQLYDWLDRLAPAEEPGPQRVLLSGGPSRCIACADMPTFAPDARMVRWHARRRKG